MRAGNRGDIKGRLTFANAVAAAALVAAVGGGAVAIGAKGPVSKSGVIKACYAKKGKQAGNVRLLVKGKCSKAEKKITWNRRGPEGAVGSDGPAGPAGSIQGASAGGDLAGSYPDPTIAPSEAPAIVAENPNTGVDPCSEAGGFQTMVLCGTAANHWDGGAGAFGGPLRVWRDRLGEVHVSGAATESAPPSVPGNGLLFRLPSSLRPTFSQRYPAVLAATDLGPASNAVVSIGSGTIAEPSLRGVVVASYDPSAATLAISVHVGNVSFRTDE